jgi:hypothetical protein
MVKLISTDLGSVGGFLLLRGAIYSVGALGVGPQLETVTLDRAQG